MVRRVTVVIDKSWRLKMNIVKLGSVVTIYDFELEEEVAYSQY